MVKINKCKGVTMIKKQSRRKKKVEIIRKIEVEMKTTEKNSIHN